MHVQPWVDRLRTTILLSYLCDADGTYRHPCVRPDAEWAGLCSRRQHARAEPEAKKTSEAALADYWKRWASTMPLKGVLEKVDWG